jgi:hypothetical protein
MAGDQGIEDHGLHALGGQQFIDMGADVSGSARDEYSTHGRKNTLVARKRQVIQQGNGFIP